MILGPFDLLVDIPCAMIGAMLGAMAALIAVLATAGHPSAVDDRQALVGVMINDFNIPEQTAAQVCEKGLPLWGRLRAKSRPFLWRLGYDWPEYNEPSKAEFVDYYARGLPEAEAALQQKEPEAEDSPESGESYTNGIQALPEAFPMPAVMSETNPEGTPGSDGIS
jgi:hypothetical protein